MALTPLPSSIGQGLNPQPSDREQSALPLDPGFCLYYYKISFLSILYWSKLIEIKNYLNLAIKAL